MHPNNNLILTLITAFRTRRTNGLDSTGHKDNAGLFDSIVGAMFYAIAYLPAARMPMRIEIDYATLAGARPAISMRVS